MPDDLTPLTRRLGYYYYKAPPLGNSEEQISELHKESDEILKKSQYNIGMPDLKFLEISFLKPTTKNQKIRG